MVILRLHILGALAIVTLSGCLWTGDTHSVDPGVINAPAVLTDAYDFSYSAEDISPTLAAQYRMQLRMIGEFSETEAQITLKNQQADAAFIAEKNDKVYIWLDGLTNDNHEMVAYVQSGNQTASNESCYEFIVTKPIAPVQKESGAISIVSGIIESDRCYQQPLAEKQAAQVDIQTAQRKLLPPEVQQELDESDTVDEDPLRFPELQR